MEEVVDLTCEGSEATVVDLTTNNDSVLVTTPHTQTVVITTNWL